MIQTLLIEYKTSHQQKKSLKIVKTCHSYLIYYIYELDIWKDKCTENGLRFKNKLRVAPNKKRFEIK